MDRFGRRKWGINITKIQLQQVREIVEEMLSS